MASKFEELLAVHYKCVAILVALFDGSIHLWFGYVVLGKSFFFCKHNYRESYLLFFIHITLTKAGKSKDITSVSQRVIEDIRVGG